ncbi:hypothetical protein CEUSTIGMA_g12078.t1 [Chlamydomonas eustigma]|uniref:Cortactin-binding protein-2 N-terminal domain-containing protein n=1 Tax=Chlamydomonas eustigma TaxID=1157962 RepID=A0A250XNK9_9CHLO|nr:hypothetical protein CEUSTIGMA_g12078.t1 [Chlamydomonas eustigma]|eukprot:GAX84657.1 hypothetical protein CEUSTIGMA_g12078.t1 [Chlamydomonas eustigma]
MSETSAEYVITDATDLKNALQMLTQERKRADSLTDQLKVAKQQYVNIQLQLEQEEEAITNKLMKRLDQLRKEKLEMEAEEEVLTQTVERRLELASQEQEAIVGKLHKQLEQLKSEKAKLHSEKIALENHLEAEQEFIMNKLNKQVEKTRVEKMNLAKEKSDLQKQVSDLASSVERLKLDKVVLEQEMEMEEENITNRLQHQVDVLLASLKQVEAKLIAKGLSLAELGITMPPIEIPGAGARIARLSSSNVGLGRISSGSTSGTCVTMLGRNSSSNICYVPQLSGTSPSRSGSHSFPLVQTLSQTSGKQQVIQAVAQQGATAALVGQPRVTT